ncbi:MAG: hypothetical protein FWE30_06790 [Bacteroidales bacterium]|nr:hypothetical protein [Bacteroidales bacterium]
MKNIVHLERELDSIFVVENGKRHVVDQTTVIVKPKSEKDEIGADVKVLFSDLLGFLTLSVPEGIDVEDYVSTLEKTDKYDTVDYNTVVEYCAVPNDSRRHEQ